MEYGRFGVLTRMELERFFHLDDEDRKLIADRRRDSNRLGFALQLVTVRYLGMFLPDPLDVPADVVEYLAEQLDIADPTCVKSYTERKQTRYDHQDEIVRCDGLTEFAQVEAELVAWVADQAWMTGDGPKALKAGAVRWLRERAALLPGVTTLDRLVAEAKQAADQRLWTHLASQLSGREAGVLLGLLETREEGRHKIVELERLRKGAFTPSSTGMKHLRLADDEPYRREAKAQAHLQEGRHDLGRTIFHGKKGEITRTYLNGMEDQLSALGLILNCVVLWNSVYLDRALAELRAQDYPVRDADAARLSAFVRKHLRPEGITVSTCPTSAVATARCAIPTHPTTTAE